MQIHNLAIMFGPSLFSTEERTNLRKLSQDKGGKSNTYKRRSGDKKSAADDTALSLGNTTSSEPNQNLAYKMVIYGQIVEFILNEFKKFSIFFNSSC